MELVEGTYTQTHYLPGAPALFAVAYALGGRAESPALDIPGAYAVPLLPVLYASAAAAAALLHERQRSLR